MFAPGDRHLAGKTGTRLNPYSWRGRWSLLFKYDTIIVKLKTKGGLALHERPDWDRYFLEIAQVVAKRSTCLRRCYGAVIVKDHIIISTGYNGAPRGENNCSDTGVCRREELRVPKGERYELCVAVHAEQNALINADPAGMKEATIYIAGFNQDGTIASGQPCLLCRRMIRNARLARVVYYTADGCIVTCRPEELLVEVTTRQG